MQPTYSRAPPKPGPQAHPTLVLCPPPVSQEVSYCLSSEARTALACPSQPTSLLSGRTVRLWTEFPPLKIHIYSSNPQWDVVGGNGVVPNKNFLYEAVSAPS